MVMIVPKPVEPSIDIMLVYSKVWFQFKTSMNSDDENEKQTLPQFCRGV